MQGRLQEKCTQVIYHRWKVDFLFLLFKMSSDDYVELSQSQIDFMADKISSRNKILLDSEKAKVIEKRRKNQVFIENIIIVILLLCVAFLWVYVRIRGLRNVYSVQYGVMSSPNFTSGVSGQSVVNHTFDDIALAHDYPAFYNIKVLVGLSTSLSVTGASFLLLIVEEYGTYLTRLSWNGSATQLNHHKIGSYLQDYAGWSQPDNPFRFMFANASDFSNSCAVLDYNANSGNSMLDILFTGGFCRYADLNSTKYSSGYEMFHKLCGKRSKFRKNCEAHRERQVCTLPQI